MVGNRSSLRQPTQDPDRECGCGKQTQNLLAVRRYKTEYECRLERQRHRQEKSGLKVEDEAWLNETQTQLTRLEQNHGRGSLM